MKWVVERKGTGIKGKGVFNLTLPLTSRATLDKLLNLSKLQFLLSPGLTSWARDLGSRTVPLLGRLCAWFNNLLLLPSNS